MSKILAFVGYLLRDIFLQLYNDVKEIFAVITKKKTWVVACFVFLLGSILLRNLRLIILSSVLFVFFFLAYQWQVFNDEYTHQQRERYWRRPKK